MNVYFKTLGCRLNEAELQEWAKTLVSHGWHLSDLEQANIIVINTCAVTAEGARKSRQQIRRLHRENPQAKIVVTGCYASLEPATVKSLLGVDWVIDNAEKDTLAEQLLSRYSSFDTERMPEMATEPGAFALFKRSRDRAFVKIQDGCRYRCTYCIVTIARGEERSRPIQQLIAQVRDLHNQGINEIVLAGVHVGGYGTDIGSSLYELVNHLLSETEIPRIRFASVEPWDLPEHFFSLFANPRLMPHMHLPLQSGSDSVLRRMSRRCRQDSFAEIVSRARQSHPDFNITTDIIVGFPGETDAEWQTSLDYIAQVGFGHIHAFSYSDREGTKASRLANKVSSEVIRGRMSELQSLAAEMKRDFLSQQQLGRAEILWESGKRPASEGRWIYQGYTPNYCRVEATSSIQLSGKLTWAEDMTMHPEGNRLVSMINEQILTESAAPIAIKQL